MSNEILSELEAWLEEEITQRWKVFQKEGLKGPVSLGIDDLMLMKAKIAELKAKEENNATR